MPDIFVSPEEKPNKEPAVLPEEKPVVEEKCQKRRVRGHSHSRFSSFNLYPEHIDFETKEKEEKVIVMLRQHPIVNLKWIVISILPFFCPFFFGKTGLMSSLPDGYSSVIFMTWYLVTFAYAMEGFFNWYFNVFFITTHRVIDVDFFNLINKRVSDAEIEKIQDVSYSTSGPIGTVFNFGDVLIQTASELTELSFERVPNPEKVADILNDLRSKVH